MLSIWTKLLIFKLISVNQNQQHQHTHQFSSNNIITQYTIITIIILLENYQQSSGSAQTILSQYTNNLKDPAFIRFCIINRPTPTLFHKIQLHADKTSQFEVKVLKIFINFLVLFRQTPLRWYYYVNSNWIAIYRHDTINVITMYFLLIMHSNVLSLSLNNICW